VYKVANEDTARVHWLEHQLPSVGLRPDTVYGPGRDFGLTADPTIAMKAVLLGRPFHIRWGGRRDFQYVGDVARAFVRASEIDVKGAAVYNLHGEVASVAEVVELIRERTHGGRGLVTYDAGTEVPVAGAYDDAALQRDLGPLPRTSLRDGVSRTMERFERLLLEGRLDVRELG
jgi:nucleoside-diphosphate-sugar epimerase